MPEETPPPQEPSGLDALYSKPQESAPAETTPIEQAPAEPDPAQTPESSPPAVAQPVYAGPPPPAPPPPPAYGYYTPPPTRPRSRGCLIAVVIVGVVIVASVAVPMLLALARSGDLSTGGKVGVISLTGLIRGGATRSLFGAVGGADVVIAQLRQAEEDSSVKAVLLRIDSPGGSAAASAAIYHAVQRLQAKKPVIVSMGDVAASGGYYSASAAGTIMANPATETGSIGVIMRGMNYSGLMNRYGVTDQTIATGPYKDTGNPQRPMRPDERVYIKGMLADIYDQFVTDVAAGRRMDVAAVRKLADGRVYTGRQAKKLGLVDELGDYHDALELAWKKAGLTGEPRTKSFGRTSLFGAMLEDSVRILPRSASPQQMLVEQALQQQSASSVDLLVMPGYYETQVR